MCACWHVLAHLRQGEDNRSCDTLWIFKNTKTVFFLIWLDQQNQEEMLKVDKRWGSKCARHTPLPSPLRRASFMATRELQSWPYLVPVVNSPSAEDWYQTRHQVSGMVNPSNWRSPTFSWTRPPAQTCHSKSWLLSQLHIYQLRYWFCQFWHC